jgi:hypothetical protein
MFNSAAPTIRKKRKVQSTQKLIGEPKQCTIVPPPKQYNSAFLDLSQANESATDIDEDNNSDHSSIATVTGGMYNYNEEEFDDNQL